MRKWIKENEWFKNKLSENFIKEYMANNPDDPVVADLVSVRNASQVKK